VPSVFVDFVRLIRVKLSLRKIQRTALFPW